MARLSPVLFSSQSEDRLGDIAKTLAAVGGSPESHHFVLANHPPALATFVAAANYIRTESALAPRLREVAALATAAALSSEFVWTAHVSLALRVGIEPAELNSIKEYTSGDQPALPPTDLLIVDCCFQLAETPA